MQYQIVSTETDSSLDIFDSQRFLEFGQTANAYASNNVFSEYLSKRTRNSRDAIQKDLESFTAFLIEGGAIEPHTNADVFYNPDAWQFITWGIVKAFVQWNLSKGFAISTVNRRLSTARTFSSLAMQTGTIDATEAALIQTVKAIGSKDGRNIDANREVSRIERKGSKKADSVLITDEHAKLLKTQHGPSQQGRKDALTMSLLIDLGLRCSEAVAIQLSDVDLNNELIHIYRIKTDKHQHLAMTKDVRMAVRKYLEIRGNEDGQLLLNTSRRSITARVAKLGIQYGYYREERKNDSRYTDGFKVAQVGSLSAHDMRHYLATKLSREGLNAHQLMESMGWASITTAQRYIEDSAIANEAAVRIID